MPSETASPVSSDSNVSTISTAPSVTTAPASYFQHYKTNITLAIPVMFTQAGHMVVQITDNIMVGRIGAIALAASSFGHNVFIGGLLFTIGFTAAMTPMVGAAHGKGDVREAVSWFKNGFVANMMLSAAVTVAMLFIALFLDNMGQTPDVARLARPFYILLVLSIAPTIVFQSLKQFAEGLGNTRLAAFITVQEITLNVGLNYVLITGQLGFPALGIVGSGIASLIARCSMALTFGLMFWRLEFFRPYRAAWHEAVLDWAKIRSFARLGVQLGGQTVLEVAAFALGAIMMGWLGAIELAAHQIAIGLAALSFMGAQGIAAASTIKVAHYFGAHDRLNMRRTAFASMHIVLAYETLTALGFIIFRHQLPTVYINDVAVITMAANLLLVAAIFQLVDGLQVVLLGSLRGIADARTPTIIAFVAYMLVSLPVSYLAAFTLGWRETGIWTGYLFGLGAASILYFMRFVAKSKRVGFAPAS